VNAGQPSAVDRGIKDDFDCRFGIRIGNAVFVYSAVDYGAIHTVLGFSGNLVAVRRNDHTRFVPFCDCEVAR